MIMINRERRANVVGFDGQGNETRIISSVTKCTTEDLLDVVAKIPNDAGCKDNHIGFDLGSIRKHESILCASHSGSTGLHFDLPRC